MTNTFLVLLVILSTVVVIHAFVRAPTSSHYRHRRNGARLFLNADELSPVIEGARNEAFLWFFGTSGGAGIALAQFPKMYQNSMAIRDMKDVGPTENGETLGISPLCGYPQDLSKADVIKIVNNPKSVTQMVEENPYPDNFMAAKGYLIYPAFVDANPDCNPLALRAVFDTFSQSTNIVEPAVAHQMLDSYKADPSGETFKNALLLSKLKGFAAIFTLLFLLGVAGTIVTADVAKGWFPDWPGLGNFPESLWNPGFWTIPEYWI